VLLHRPGMEELLGRCGLVLHRRRMVVARALVDRTLADELRDACTSVALNLGVWDKQSKSKTGNPIAENPKPLAHRKGDEMILCAAYILGPVAASL